MIVLTLNSSTCESYLQKSTLKMVQLLSGGSDQLIQYVLYVYPCFNETRFVLPSPDCEIPVFRQTSRRARGGRLNAPPSSWWSRKRYTNRAQLAQTIVISCRTFLIGLLNYCFIFLHMRFCCLAALRKAGHFQ